MPIARCEAGVIQAEAKRDERARDTQNITSSWFGSIDINRDAEEVSRINGAAQSGEHRRLLDVELTARGLERFTRENPSILGELRLPSFEHSDRMVWPPPRIFDQSMFAPVPFDRRYSPEWWRMQEDERQASREQGEREAAEREAPTRSMVTTGQDGGSAQVKV